MKRITKENLSTVFQLTAIIFLFSYSSSSTKVGTTTFPPAPAAQPQIEKRPEVINAITNYYAAKNTQGLLHASLTMVLNLKNTSTIIDTKEKAATNENRASYAMLQPLLNSK